MADRADGPLIAVLIPCWNEAQSIAAVVAAFRRAVPAAVIYVYDNNSTDATAAIAAEAGAQVRLERRQGKGHVVRRMFADVEADIYVLVDGDATYDARSAPAMIDLMVSEHLDFVNGRRVDFAREAFRSGHQFGNTVLSLLVRSIFGSGFADMLSGYKVLSRRFVKSIPLLSGGFEIETEIAVHALSLRLPIAEIDTPYQTRPAGSASKLRTWPDGFRILRTILLLLKEERPLAFFSVVALVFAALSIVLALPVIVTFFETGLVPRLPTAVLAATVMLLAFLSLTCGLILATVTRGRQEIKRLAYLAMSSRSG